jgi:hypothetical protein
MYSQNDFACSRELVSSSISRVASSLHLDCLYPIKIGHVKSLVEVVEENRCRSPKSIDVFPTSACQRKS